MNKNYDDMNKLSLDTKIKSFEDGFYEFFDTVFFGKKGGALDDKGKINGLDLIELKWDGDRLLHKVDGVLQDPIFMQVDEKTRFLNASVQTAFHILDGYFRNKDLYLPEVSEDPKNLWFELNKKNLSQEELDQIEEYVGKVIRDDIKLEYSYINGKDYHDPNYHKFEELRIVEIPGVDKQACGTYHVNSTGQIGSFAILSSENTKRGTKVHVAINQNTQEQLKAKNKDLMEIAKILSTGLDDLVEKVKEINDGYKSLKKEEKILSEKLIGYKAKDLEDEKEDILYLEDEKSSNIRNLASELLKNKSHIKAIFTKENKEVFFAFISLDNKARDYLNKLKEKGIFVKGGGSPSIVSGKFDLDESKDYKNLFEEIIKN